MPSKIRHGHAVEGKPSRTYNSWSQMLGRCNNRNNPGYGDYGGRGIAVCARWVRFDNFLEDMGVRPERTTLGRINNKKGYSKSNCRWETKKQQQRNKRDSVFLTLNGRRRQLDEWCEVLGWPRHVIRGRLRLGWSHRDTLTIKPRKRPNGIV